MAAPHDWPETLIATHSGLRGRPGIDLTPEVVERVVRSFLTLLRRRSTSPGVGLARDERPDGHELAAQVSRAILHAGFDVVDFGDISTPTAKLAARREGLGGAVVVTASHLSAEWNGLKLVAAPDYLPVDVRELVPIPEALETSVAGSVIRHPNAVSDHVVALCSSVDVELIRSASLRVTCRGGVGSLGEILLERLGCGTAGRRPDLGLVLDQDGDRLQLVDETGERLDPEVVLPLVAVASRARKVIKGADTSRTVDEVVRGNGGTVTVVPPGELHIVEELLRLRGDLAGEGNGGVVRPAAGRARDGLAAGVAIVELVARSGQPLSELVTELPSFSRVRWTIACAADRAGELLGSLAAHLGLPQPQNAEEGIMLETGEAWALVRRSATEHVVRVTVEGRDDAAAESLRRELDAALRLQLQPA